MIFIQRLDKILVNLGLGSRTEIKNIAKSGRIFVNGEKCTKTDIKVNPDKDEIVFCGKTVKYAENIYIMLNKKAGYITATEDKADKTVMDLLSKELSKIELFPVGRLDKDTEGLLIITNDGKLSHELTSPKKDVFKKYYVEVLGEILNEHIEKFESGIVFRDSTKLKPAKLEILDKNKAYVSISEGKFHQVKNMFRTIDCTVEYLKRVAVGDLVLDDSLEIGEYRYLTDDEVEYLKNIRGN